MTATTPTKPALCAVTTLKHVVAAWEALPGPRYYTRSEVAAWLSISMKPAIDAARAVLAAAPAPTANSQKPYAYAWRYAGEVTWHLSFDKPRARYHDDIEYHELFLGPTTNEDVRSALVKAVADRDALRNALTDLLSICRPGGERTPARAIYDRARTLATPETESRDA